MKWSCQSSWKWSANSSWWTFGLQMCFHWQSHWIYRKHFRRFPSCVSYLCSERVPVGFPQCRYILRTISVSMECVAIFLRPYVIYECLICRPWLFGCSIWRPIPWLLFTRGRQHYSFCAYNNNQYRRRKWFGDNVHNFRCYDIWPWKQQRKKQGFTSKVFGEARLQCRNHFLFRSS